MSRILYTTEFVREEMAKENCILLDEYVKGQLRIRYEYNGVVYTVRWYDWYRKDRPSRPHLTGGNRTTKLHQRWNNEKVNEIKDEMIFSFLFISLLIVIERTLFNLNSFII